VSPSTTTASTGERGPEDVVRAFLAAGGKRIDRSQFTCGPLARYFKLVDETEDPAEEVSSRLEVDQLVVVSLESDRAEIALAARSTVEMTHPLVARYSVELDYSGRVHLQRIGHEWKIADYVLDGRRALQSIVFPHQARTQANGLSLELLALDRQRAQTVAILELTNARTQPIDLAYGALRFRKRFLPRWDTNRVLGVNQVPARGRLRTHVAWPVCLPLSLGRLRLRVGAQEVVAGKRFDLTVEVATPRSFADPGAGSTDDACSVPSRASARTDL
jgi:hypothetical protein